MHRFVVLLGLAALLVLPACQSGFMKKDSEVASQESVQAQEETISQESQARESAEFYGQAPKIEDIPEKVVLEAKNGNVTLPHRDHAKMTDCKTCHEGTPGKMPQFNKDKAHPLCMGCHKEKGAGPTTCSGCHKKA